MSWIVHRCPPEEWKTWSEAYWQVSDQGRGAVTHLSCAEWWPNLIYLSCRLSNFDLNLIKLQVYVAIIQDFSGWPSTICYQIKLLGKHEETSFTYHEHQLCDRIVPTRQKCDIFLFLFPCRNNVPTMDFATMSQQWILQQEEDESVISLPARSFAV